MFEPIIAASLNLAAYTNPFGYVPADTCGCDLGAFLAFANTNNLFVTDNINQFVVVVALIGAVIGVVAWEVFKYSYNYGKQHSPKK
jgi:uncharacterized membrane protein YeaQ/YmgE (transglycosylase-associated protein family)